MVRGPLLSERMRAGLIRLVNGLYMTTYEAQAPLGCEGEEDLIEKKLEDNIKKSVVSKPEWVAQEYLGDGLYANYDGHGIWLYANHHEHPTDKVYLEPSVYATLKRFMERVAV
jgi:hypothetical protein